MAEKDDWLDAMPAPEGFTPVGTAPAPTTAKEPSEDWLDAMPPPDAMEPVEKIEEAVPASRGVPLAALQGITANYGDELVAGALAVAGEADPRVAHKQTIPERYKTIRDSLRQTHKQFAEESPVVAAASEIAGGMVPISRGLSAADAAARTVGQRLASGAAVGGGYGLADYTGRVEDYSEMTPAEAATSAAVGASIPVALTGMGEGVRRLFRRFKNSTGDDASDILKELVTATGMRPEEIQTIADRMGPEASLVDVTGDVGVGFAQGARSTGDMTTHKVIENNLKKIRGGKGRIKQVAEEVTTVGQKEFYPTLEGLKAATRANAEKNYGAALDNSFLQYDVDIARLLHKKGPVKDAWERVIENNSYYRNYPKPPKHDETVMPSMRAIQEMKFELDADIRAMVKSDNSMDRRMGQRVRKELNLLLDRVYEQFPEFKIANRVYAGDKAIEDALELGMTHGLNKLNVQSQLKEIRALTPSEKEAYLKGVMANVYDKLGKSREDILGNLNHLSSENAEDVLTELVGSSNARRVMDRIAVERRYREVDQKVRQGSQTEPREVAKKLFGEPTSVAKAADLIMEQSPTRKAIGLMTGKTKVPPETIAEIADLLTKPGGVEEAIRRVGEPQLHDLINRGFFANLGISGLTSAAAYEQP